MVLISYYLYKFHLEVLSNRMNQQNFSYRITLKIIFIVFKIQIVVVVETWNLISAVELIQFMVFMVLCKSFLKTLLVIILISLIKITFSNICSVNFIFKFLQNCVLI